MVDSWVWAVVSIGIIVLAIIIGLIVLIVANRRARKAAAHEAASRPPAELFSFTSLGKAAPPKRVWIVANPTKPEDYGEFRRKVAEAVLEATGQPAMWIETTVKDPGTGQAIEALKHNPSLVLAAGGDGTVRAVAAGMAHSKVPLGLLPMGTGNLLARNLELPLDLDKALKVALGPLDRHIDLAWMRLGKVAEQATIPAEGKLLLDAGAAEVRSLPKGVTEPLADEFAYTVIAGVGFDGETMAQTTPELKKKVGWTAYVLTALKSLWIERMRATVTIFHDKDNPASNYTPERRGKIPQKVEHAVRQSHTIGSPTGVSPASSSGATWDMTSLRARTILFANCGTLPFAVLAPHAKIDDGKLDVIAIDTRGGLFGWMYLTAKVWGQSAGVKPLNLKNDVGSIQFRQTASARVDIASPYPVQIDGDPIGSARTILVRVDKDALIIRVPVPLDEEVPQVSGQ